MERKNHVWSTHPDVEVASRKVCVGRHRRLTHLATRRAWVLGGHLIALGRILAAGGAGDRRGALQVLRARGVMVDAAWRCTNVIRGVSGNASRVITIYKYEQRLLLCSVLLLPTLNECNSAMLPRSNIPSRYGCHHGRTDCVEASYYPAWLPVRYGCA